MRLISSGLPLGALLSTSIYAVGAWLNGEHEAVVVTTFDDPLHMQVMADLSPMEQRLDLRCPLTA